MTDISQSAGDDSATDEAKAQAKHLAETGKSEAQSIKEEVKSQGSQLLSEAGTQARNRADTQVSEIASLLGSAADELDQMASGSSDANGIVTRLARDGASTARRVADRLDQDGLTGALSDVRSFARQRPGAFLAGSFAVGLLLGRVTRNADLQAIAHQVSGADSVEPSHDASHGSLAGARSVPPASSLTSTAPSPTMAERIDPGLPA